MKVNPKFMAKEGEGEGSLLCGQWKEKEKVLCLVANGKRKRRFPCLEANGMFQACWPMEGEGKIPFHLFPLSPQPILLKPSIFPFDLKLLLYHGTKLILTHFLPFLDL